MRFISIALSAFLVFAPSCLFAQEQSDKKTIASFLEEYPGDEFSDFITILKKANLWAQLDNKDSYQACFAPKNSAIRDYLLERKIAETNPSRRSYFENVESLPNYIADSIARTHISIRIADLPDEDNRPCFEVFPNILGEIITYDRMHSQINSSTPEILRFINQKARITQINIPLVNGFVHILDDVIRDNNYLLPGYLRENNNRADNSHKATIFYDALRQTGLSDTLKQYLDLSYLTPAYDSTYACLEMTGRVAVEYETGYENFSNGQQQRVIWPDQRLFKYTLFVVSDSVLKRVYGINSVNDLKAKAKSVYPEGALLPDTDSNSSLYKLLAYHILPCWLNRNMLNYTDKYIIDDYKAACPDSIDMEDFYETLQNSIMRISTPYDKGSGNNGKNIYINRKGTVSAGNLEAEGIRIWRLVEVPEISTIDALNGGYYFVDSLLFFDQHTKNALNTRIRVMFSTLSPDFINSGARGRMRQSMGDKPTSFAVYAFKEGFCNNVSSSPETMFVVRYMDKNWNTYYSDELTVKGNFDITFRLPPVPSSGLYEVRVSGNTSSYSEAIRKRRGSILYYICQEGNENIPCGTPVDMTIIPTDSLIGYVSDRDLSLSRTPEEADAAILENEKFMRKNGYMKYPDSYTSSSSTILRDDNSLFRKIVCEMYMEAGKHYYLRLRQLKGFESEIPLNFLEIVPYSVYSGENGPEDRH